jgi:hypothetical protein
MLITVVLGGVNGPMIGTRVAFRGAFGPHEGIVLEETEDSVILKVEKNNTLGNLGQVTIWKTSLRPLSILEEV